MKEILCRIFRRRFGGLEGASEERRNLFSRNFAEQTAPRSLRPQAPKRRAHASKTTMATTTAATPPTAAASSAASVTPNLVPLRVDVTSDDCSIRLIDTLLFDPHCWPIPLYSPLEESIERNVQELAHSMVADVEVYGMGRTTRHFTGRVDVWSPSLQAKVAQQLRPQLWSLVEKTAPETRMVQIRLRLCIHGVTINDDFEWDPSVPQCPIAFARQLAKDMNLPEEAPPAIAAAIVEQLHGVSVDGESTVASAYHVDPREQVTNISHLAALHRPVQLDPRTTLA